MTVTSPYAVRFRAGVLLAAGVLVLAGCSGGGGRRTPGLPEPVAGRVVAFDPGGLGDEDLDGGFRAFGALVQSDAAGNVYVIPDRSTPGSDAVRITPEGRAVPFTRARLMGELDQLVVIRDGTAVVRGSYPVRTDPAALYSLDREGSVTPLPSSHAFRHPVVVGEYPAGTLVVGDDSGLWAVRNGRATRLPGKEGDFSLGSKANVLDRAGNVYAMGGTVGETRVQPPGRAAHALTVPGSTPDHVPLARLEVADVASASAGGFYAVAYPGYSGPYYVLHVTPAGAGTTVLARLDLHAPGCAAGKDYPSLRSPCVPSVLLAESGRRLLLLGSLAPAAPALVLPAV